MAGWIRRVSTSAVQILRGLRGSGRKRVLGSGTTRPGRSSGRRPDGPGHQGGGRGAMVWRGGRQRRAARARGSRHARGGGRGGGREGVGGVGRRTRSGDRDERAAGRGAGGRRRTTSPFRSPQSGADTRPSGGGRVGVSQHARRGSELRAPPTATSGAPRGPRSHLVGPVVRRGDQGERWGEGGGEGEEEGRVSGRGWRKGTTCWECVCVGRGGGGATLRVDFVRLVQLLLLVGLDHEVGERVGHAQESIALAHLRRGEGRGGEV